MRDRVLKFYECIREFEVAGVNDDLEIVDGLPPIKVVTGSIWEVEFIGNEPNWLAYRVDENDDGTTLYDFETDDWEDTKYFKEVELEG